jgi:hypothetical protein
MSATVGISVAVSRGVIAALEPWLGFGWAFAAGLLAAAIVGAGVGLVACCFFRPTRGGEPKGPQ